MNTKLSFLLAIALLLIIKISGHAQQYAQQTNAPWHEGKIILGDESTLSGMIQYINGDVTLFFKENMDDEDKTMIYTSNILSLEYYDESLGITTQWHFQTYKPAKRKLPFMKY